MNVPAMAVAEITKFGGKAVIRLLDDITKFNIEKIHLKCTAVDCMYGMVKVYTDCNKTYIEASDKYMGKILDKIPNNADPDKVIDLLNQCQKSNTFLKATGMICSTILGSSVAIAMGIVLRQPPQIHNHIHNHISIFDRGK